MSPDTPDEPFPDDDSPEPMNEPGAHAPPAELDYEVIRLIGSGGYGEVWLVRDQAGDYHACKVVYRESFAEDRPYEREYNGIRKFEPASQASESQMKILHVGRRDAAGYFFYIMELADDLHAGRMIYPNHYEPRTLRSELDRKKRLRISDCLQIGQDLCAALENLHRQGLIHRDIKPGNIVFVNGRPKLADIGLVTDVDASVSYVGTDGYIPPEGPTSPRADIYGLGKVLYEISTGKDRLEYPELPGNFAEIPDWELLLELNAIITKACETNPDRRYRSAKELHGDLAALASGKSVRQQRSYQRIRLVIAQISSVLVAGGLITGALIHWFKHSDQPQSGRLPVPDAAVLAQCEAKLKLVFFDQTASGPAAAEQQAAELYSRSSAESDPAMELASLRVAARLEIECADFDKAMEMCDRMAERFDLDISQVKAELLAGAVAQSATTRNKGELADACLAAGFQAVANDDYESAQTIANLATAAAQPTGNTNFIREAAFLNEKTAQCAAAFAAVATAATALRENRNDPAANLAMGKFLCFVKNDWAAGLALMARGGDPAFAPVANKEIGAKPDHPSDQAALGNLWWDLSVRATNDNMAGCQQRARHWYLKAIAGSKEPDKSQLRQNLSDRIQAVPTETAEVHIVSRVGGTEFIDIYDDEVQWHSSRRGAVGNKINQVNLGDFGASDLQIIKNSGDTWLMPGAVDFLTAKLSRDRRTGRHGQAQLAVFEDHVRVTLAHPREGSAPLDVTVSFGTPP